MTNLSYVRAEPKRLRDLGFDEKWLQDRINEDPSILGLGDLVVITREHAQPTGGRIDFLMYDPEEEARYEIEVMLVSCPNSSMHYYGGSPYREPPWLVDALGSSPSGSVTVNARS